MATFPQWTYPPSEATYNPALPTSVSSYFVRPSRVVKPNSRNTSPRILGRRKTTSAVSVSSRNRSAVDHLHSTAQWHDPGVPRSRPISWHPDYFEASNSNLSATVNGEDSCWGFSTAQVNGLVTPVCHPSMHEPQIHELFTPLDELSALDHGLALGNQHYHQQSWLGQAQDKVESYPFALHGQEAPLQSTWHHNQVAIISNVPTAPASPNCPPLQTIGLDTLSLGNNSKSKDGTDELVGMGLYDSPAEVQSSSLLFGGYSGSGRKGLKLEESFEPSEQEDDEGEESDSDEQDEHGVENEVSTDTWDLTDATEYDSQSIASHLTYGIQARPEPLATEYLATLRQMNSTYYPSDYSGYNQGYGWI